MMITDEVVNGHLSSFWNVMDLQSVVDQDWTAAVFQGRGRTPYEAVYIGFIGVNDNGSIYWVSVPNNAPEQDRHRRFEVSGIEVASVLKKVSDEYPAARLKALWHSHYVSEEPSTVDVEFFPGIMFDVGIVYHAPSGRSTFYNADGVI